MIYPLLLEIVLFTTYLLLIVRKYGVLGSISESYYTLPRNKNYLFTIFMMSIGIINILTGNIYLVLSGAGLAFTGVAAQYRNRITNAVHYIGAVIGYALGCLAISPFFLVFIVILSAILKQTVIENKTWWTEVIAFYLIMIGLLIKYM